MKMHITLRGPITAHLNAQAAQQFATREAADREEFRAIFERLGESPGRICFTVEKVVNTLEQEPGDVISRPRVQELIDLADCAHLNGHTLEIHILEPKDERAQAYVDLETYDYLAAGAALPGRRGS